MRVLMVNKFHWLHGGTERYIWELTAALRRAGHEVVPFTMAHPRNEASAYSEYFVSSIDLFDRGRLAPWLVAERVIYSREARRNIACLIEATRPDVAHLHNIYHHISPSILDALHEGGIPVVMTLHDYKQICPTYSLWTDGAVCERCRGGRYYQCVANRCNRGSLRASSLNAVEAYVHRRIRLYDKVNLFICPSQFLLRKHVEHGFSAERLAHIANFLDLERYHPHYEHGSYFAYVGRLVRFKGVETLLRAVAKVLPSQPLLIVGDGPERRSLEEEAARLSLVNVRFIGHHRGAALRDIVARASLVVVPSEWYENCPYAVLEAMVLGTPVLGTAIGGIPELIEDGATGLLVPPGDADALAEGLHRMLGQGAHLREMGRAGREYIERTHGPELHLARVLRVYAEAGARVR